MNQEASSSSNLNNQERSRAHNMQDREIIGRSKSPEKSITQGILENTNNQDDIDGSKFKYVSVQPMYILISLILFIGGQKASINLDQSLSTSGKCQRSRKRHMGLIQTSLKMESLKYLDFLPLSFKTIADQQIIHRIIRTN
ncbi:hypothetical protein FGO68_gene4503 [Halteria grandinella]|uniref:Uncharacterized protein n=1 Tax=Halteria grandinella TaxID=5974 RepID=A0A8J8P731_HALGN|nr:hypothetical protein FGO68_gene4503 [Halteria grandinella]